MSDLAKKLIKQSESLFSKKSPILTLWQELALNFYPQRADFTINRSMGEEFASHLMTSHPLIYHRTISDLAQQILQPVSIPWISMRKRYGHDELSQESKKYIERMASKQRQAMYDPVAQYVRSSKEMFRDVFAFGQAALEIDFSVKNNALIYRVEHLRDMAWCENENREIDTIYVKKKLTARQLVSLFGQKCSDRVREAANKDPYQEFNCLRCIVPSEYYEGAQKFNQPYTVVFLEENDSNILEEVGSLTKKYVIPRMATVSGSQYGFSPCSMIALPAARALQIMMLTLIEAGEKAVDPPTIYNSRIIKSDLSLFAGGATRADLEEGQRLSDSLMPIPSDYSGLTKAQEQFEAIKRELYEAFYLDKLNLPPDDGVERTAYELSKRLQQSSRDASPIFEPILTEINAPICEDTFTLLMENGLFGGKEAVPEELRGEAIDFVFENPLQNIKDESLSQQLMEILQLTQTVAQIDPKVIQDLDIRTAYREAISGSGAPESWIRDKSDADQIIIDQQQSEEEAAAIEQAQQVAVTANVAGQAAHSLKTAGVE